jgi:hypothetical protein
MQSFDIEVAARKALDELVDHFHSLNDKVLDKLEDVKSIAKYAK